MKKTVKKFLSMLLVLLMVLSILPTAVFATEQTTVAAPLDSLVPYGANDQITGTATIHVRDPVTFTGYSAFENVPYYLVTLPAGTTYVKATYQDAALLTNATSGEASGYYADVQQWTGGGVEMAYTESDGAITITIPMNYSHTAEDGTTVQKSFVLGADGSGNAFAPEYDSSASYAPVHFLAFEYASKSAPTVASGAITTANVILGNAWTLDVAEMFTDADDDALTYTATVNGAAQTLNGSTLSYTPAAAGEYTIVLTATDDSGTATHTIVLTAAEGPQVPRLKNGVPDTASATVSVGYAYNLSDLQAGNIFENPDGSSLSYTDYYYYRTVGTGERKGPYYFSTALFGATTIQITENTAGTYVYEFHAMNSAGLSTDTWTLTLTVSDEIEQHYTFHVGRDMNYSTNGNRYPLIKLYETAGLDDEGADYLASYEGADGKTHYIYEDYNESITKVDDNYEISIDGQTYDLVGYSPLTLKASDFTTDAPDSTGTLADNYNNFYASLPAGRYSFRAYGYETSTGSANVYLGGHSLTLPTETNVDGGTGGGTDIYLRLHSIYTTSKKNSSDYFTAADYTARVVMPIMGGEVQGGTAYTSGNYTYYPFMMYAAGNAALWNAYVEPTETTADSFIFTQSINNTTAAGYTVVTKNLSLSQAITMTVTVPAYADFRLYFQNNNFNTGEIAPASGSTTPAEGAGTADTRQLTYKISKSNSNYTWRLEDNRSGVTNYVTKAGWLKSNSADFSKTFTFTSEDSTDQYSHNFGKLGTVTATRDEAEIQAYLDPTGYKYTDKVSERIRAYRLWQIIDSDAMNIMIEPEFKAQVLSETGSVKAASGGNAKGNWLDVTPNGTTIVAVNYKALDVYTTADEHGTHGGLYPATNPERTSVFVLTNDASEHGNAKANIAYHSNGLTSSRPSAWDYNYDNWFYLSSDTAPTLDFSVSSSGATTVQYAIVTTDGTTMISDLSGWTTLTADSNGKYHASLLGFRNAEQAGGTVIIKMSDSTGTSYCLARVAEVTATVKNASNPQETEIMPGDKVSLTFEGSYRGIYKYSGIFNPTTYNLFYTCGGTDYKTNVAQYQQMDQAKLELTIPTNVDFGSGSTADVPLTNGYTYGSMYSAANPFATLYNMTDTGVGTNFNAVTVNFCLNRFPDVNVTVVPRYTFKLKMNITNPTTATPTVTLTDAAGNVYTANSSFEFEDLPYGTYTYTVSCAGCNYAYGSFYLGSADKADISSGMLTKDITLTASTTGAWDGVTLTQPTLTDGVYQIGTGAELAWFANQVNSGSSSIRAVLTADIDLAYYNWTPIAQTTSNTFAGSFDGQGHTVNNFGIYYNTTGTGVLYKGLFGYIYGSSSSYAVVKNVKVNGEMFLSSTGNVSNAYVGGITGGARYTTFTNVESDVDISITRVGGNWSYVAGVAGYSYGSTFTNCGNSGDIHGYQYVGGITGYATDAITGCYNGGAITGNGYVGGIVGQTTKGVTACYNTCSITGASNYVAGIVAYASGASASVKNCYNRAYVESTGSYVGAVVGMTNNASAAMENLYYLDFTCTQGIGSAKSTAQTATAKTRAEMAAADFVTTMNTDMAGTFGSSRYSPALSWQTDLIGLVTPTKGNVNLDPFGYVDEEDLTLLTQWAAERKTSADLTAEQWAQADINGDGVLDRNDTTALRRYVNNPSEYPLR